MNPNYRKYLNIALSKKNENQRLIKKLGKLPSKKTTHLINQLHENAFDNIDCLQCANCCSSISPIVTDRDISRLSKATKQKPSKLVSDYLLLDHENDYVMNCTPCPFLLPDNYCLYYESRPLACKGYPHTDSDKIGRKLKLTLKNTEICPAVCYIFEELKKQI